MSSEAWADLKVTPRLTVDERYDNNILATPANKKDDFLTDIAPRALILYEGPYVDVTADLGVMWTQFAKNEKLSYFSTTGGGTVKADSLTNRMIRGWNLSVTEAYSYTKDYPTFATLGTATPVVVSSGVETTRVTTFANIAGLTTSYELTPRTKLVGGYTNSRLEFGSGTEGATPFVNNTINAYNAGVEYGTSPTTTLLANYLYQQFDFERALFGTSDTATLVRTTHGGEVGVRKHFQNDLDLEARGGATYVYFLERFTPTFFLGARKKTGDTEFEAFYVRYLTNSGGLAPFIAAQELFQVLVAQHFTPNFTASLAVAHAHTKSIPGFALDVDAYSLVPGISYKVAKWATLFATYAYLRQDAGSGVGSSLNRTMVTAGITLTWF